MSKPNRSVHAQYESIKPQPHELRHTVCRMCHKSVPVAHMSLLPGREGLCRLCDYGPEYARLADVPNMLGEITEALKFRHKYYRGMRTHAERTHQE